MTLISITGWTSGQQCGREAEVYETNLDLLFDVMNRGRPTSASARKRLAAEVDAILEAAGGLLPITASARKGTKVVRLASDKSRPDLAAFTDKFWADYRARHPQPQQKRRPLIDTMRGQR